VAGTDDAILAVVLYKVAFVRMFQSIAAGLLGRASYEGGLWTAALGMALHYFIATTASAVYYAASLKLPVLIRRAVPCGLAFGVGIYFFMNYVVLQLSAVPRKPTLSLAVLQNPTWWIALVGHMLIIGLPIALINRWSARRSAPGAAPDGGEPVRSGERRSPDRATYLG
jgi:hypothetical protein